MLETLNVCLEDLNDDACENLSGGAGKPHAKVHQPGSPDIYVEPEKDEKVNWYYNPLKGIWEFNVVKK